MDGVLSVGKFSNTAGVTENFALLETSQSQTPDAAFGLLRRTLRVQIPYSDCRKRKTPSLLGWCFLFGDPDGIRTRVTAVKGRCLRPLDHRAGWWL